MEQRALEFWKLFVQQPRLWEGWDHGNTPLAFHDNQQALLFGHPNPGPEFTEKTAEGVRYHLAIPKPPSFTANTSVEVNGVFTATVMWHDRDQESMLGLITHEAFHAYQMTKGCPFGSIAVAMKYPVNDSLVQALAEVEAELLFQALTGTTKAELVTAALDARAARQASLSAEVAAFEDEVELGEGLATYIEIKTAGPGSKLWRTKIQGLKKLNREAWGADRLRFYYSGMAWALVCDSFAPGWQSREWEPLAGIVAEALNHKPDLQRIDFPGLDFTEILARHQREAGERQAEMDKTIAQVLPGTGLKVELLTKGNPIGGGWDPRYAVTYPGVGRFHPTGLMYIYDTGVNFKVESNCIEGDPCRHIIFERSDLQVLVDGDRVQRGTCRGRLEITGADSSVVMPRAKVTLSGDTLIAEEITEH